MATRKGGDASLVRIPYDTQIELYLLGATLISRPALLSVVDKVRPEHFFDETHRVLFQGIRNLYEADDGLDSLTLKNELRRMGKLEYVGGLRTIRRAMEHVPSAANAEGYARIILEMAARRRAMDVANRLLAWGESRFTTWAQRISVRVALTELRRLRWRDVSLDEALERHEQTGSRKDAFADEEPTPEELSTRTRRRSSADRRQDRYTGGPGV